MSAELTMVAVIRSVSTGKHVTIKLGNQRANLKVSVCFKCKVLTRTLPVNCIVQRAAGLLSEEPF